MTPLHQEIGKRQNSRRGKISEKVVKGHDMVEEAGGVEVLQDLPAAGIKKSPTDEDAQDKDDAAIQLRFGHIHCLLPEVKVVLHGWSEVSISSHSKRGSALHFGDQVQAATRALLEDSGTQLLVSVKGLWRR